MGYDFHPNPGDWVRTQVVRNGVDKSVALNIRYTGSQVAAHVSTAATTCDMTFEQGATTGAAATTTGNNPILPVGGTAGVINISDASASTYFKVMNAINLAADWECWMSDCPPDLITEISAGNGNVIVAADSDCTGANGFAVLLDTSLLTAEQYYAGITFNGPGTDPHNKDMQSVHELLQIQATATYSGGAETIEIFECDDNAGTKISVGGPYTHSATTATDSIPGTVIAEPIVAVRGKRMVVAMNNDTGAHTVPKLILTRRSIVTGPAVRKSKQWAYLQD